MLKIDKVKNGWIVYLKPEHPGTVPDQYVFTDAEKLGDFVTSYASGEYHEKTNASS